MTDILFNNIMDMYTISCPHCNGIIQILKKEINCKIFRHGVYKNNNLPIPPHTIKTECDRLFTQKIINGCGKPFIFDGNIVKICDYI